MEYVISENMKSFHGEGTQSQTQLLLLHASAMTWLNLHQQIYCGLLYLKNQIESLLTEWLNEISATQAWDLGLCGGVAIAKSKATAGFITQTPSQVPSSQESWLSELFGLPHSLQNCGSLSVMSQFVWVSSSFWAPRIKVTSSSSLTRSCQKIWVYKI